MPAAEPRYCVAQVTEEARDAWRDFCERHSVDRNALGEVLGLRLAEMGDHPPALVERWLRETKALMNERKRRG